MQHSTPISHSPTVRIHQSSPIHYPQQQQQQHQQPMLAPSPFVGGGYEGYTGYLSAVPKGFKDRSAHKRASSGSSIASAGPPSPLSQTTMHPRIATSDSTFSPPYDFDFTATPQTAASSKSMPNAENMIFQSNGAYGAVDMRRIHSGGNDDRAYAGAQSVSSMSHDSPATPQTNYGTEYDDSKVFRGYPSVAYQQSLHDVFPNQEYTTQMVYPQMQQQQQQQRTHRPSMMQDRLQAAQQDHLRVNSPASNPREKSPFRPSSDFNMPAPVQRPTPQVPSLQKQRTSISPKELMLDEHDVDDSSFSTPLFHDQSQYAHRRGKSNLVNSYTPFSQESSVGIPQQYPFVSQQSRQDTSTGLGDTPEFPAHLLSMESTTDDGPSEPSSQQSMVRIKSEMSQPQPQRPVDTSTDAGTYSCTYHGCALRFESPAKLQKHKREGHRQHSPATSATQSARNSQAGPHRCERINPSTGKPCNSVFSRPYDLTRHEDTIHNNRKQKVRCHLCTEEKTFSRNDALTRHMRVVHPDVDWVGKQKRKTHK